MLEGVAARIGSAPAHDKMASACDGSLILDAAGRILQVSHRLRTAWEPVNCPELVGLLLVDALLPLFPTEAKRICDIKTWLHQSSLSTDSTASTYFSLNRPGRETTRLHLGELGEGRFLARFEDLSSNVEEQTWRDHLTGIGNRFFFERALDRMLTSEIGASTLFIDLDRFKPVNDTLGHAVGDALLRLVGDRLRQALREGDALARLGGDEFAVLLAGPPDKEQTAVLAARIIDLIERPYLIEGNVINIGASIGIAFAPEDGATRDELLKSADLALYHSKAAGRGVFHFFEPAMQQRAFERRCLELDLRKALVLRQFELHYQPQVDVETETVVGLEALLRWRHPKRGLLMPGQFLALSEELGLAVPIGEWVLKTACKEATRWPDSVTIAVNISPRHFETGTFAQSVERALAAAQLSGKRFEVEVTENILLCDKKAVLATLDKLRGLQVRVAMDSFGTGVASLSQLVNFPFDKIKIDRSLIAMGQQNGRNRAIVRAISALGASLGISTLAEGVETAEHLAHVRSEGCHTVQGFYYSRAVPSNELQTLVPTLFQPTQQLTFGDTA